MKKIVSFAALSLSLLACGGNKNANDAAADSIAHAADSVCCADSSKMVQMAGVYRDTIPGATGPSETLVTLTINQDKTWKMDTHYTQNKDVKDEFSQGTLTLNGDTIYLHDDMDHVYLFRTDLLQGLDADKKIPEGGRADWYDLKKLSPEAVAAIATEDSLRKAGVKPVSK